MPVKSLFGSRLFQSLAISLTANLRCCLYDGEHRAVALCKAFRSIVDSAIGNDTY